MPQARDVPPHAPATGLRLFRDQLANFPAATGLLDSGVARRPG